MNWKIESWLVKPSNGNLENIVVSVFWKCFESVVVDGKTYTGSIASNVSFGDPSPDSFIPLDDLTESDLLGWVWSYGGVEKESTESAVSKQVNDLINPPLISPLFPWSN